MIKISKVMEGAYQVTKSDNQITKKYCDTEQSAADIQLTVSFASQAMKLTVVGKRYFK